MLKFTLNRTNSIIEALSVFSLRAFMVFVISVTFIRCENSIEEIEQLTIETKDLSASTSKNVYLRYSDSAKVMVKIFAPVLEQFTSKTEPYDLMPEGLTIEFLDSLGNIESQVKSNYAIHYPKQNRLELSNDVRAYNKDGVQLNSEHIIWNSKTQKITSDDFVKITTGDEIIYGDGFEANQDFNDYKISHIKGTISIDEDDEDIQ
jgi:LPS export ABC transporter protein LptC